MVEFGVFWCLLEISCLITHYLVQCCSQWSSTCYGKYLKLLKEAIGHYRHHTSSACWEEFLHQQLLTSKCKKGGKSGCTKEKGEESTEQPPEWRLCHLGRLVPFRTPFQQLLWHLVNPYLTLPELLSPG